MSELGKDPREEVGQDLSNSISVASTFAIDELVRERLPDARPEIPEDAGITKVDSLLNSNFTL